VAPSAQALHPEGGDLLTAQFGQHALLEAVERCVGAVERELTAVERIAERQHSEVNLGVLVAGEANVADLAIAFRAFERVDDASAREVEIGLVELDALVDLPQIEAVRGQGPRRFIAL